MKNIIITGANGFTGSHILESFSEDLVSDYQIIAACRTESKLPNWYLGIMMIGDLRNQKYIKDLTENAEVICHAAAFTEMNGTNKDSKEYFYNPTINLINSALKNGVKRFVFLSAITSIPIAENRIHTKHPLNKIWAHYYNVIKIENYLKEISQKGMEIIILRIGYFTGKNYALGLLPILLPRLKTHLVPWINNGKTTLPLIDGRDVGMAFKLAALIELNENFNCIVTVGKEVPTVKQVFQYLNKKHHYPLPHFSVSFKFAYGFARFMRFIHKLIPGDPLIVPAIVLLLEETNSNNILAEKILNYQPKIHWKESIDLQISEMKMKQTSNMKMNRKNA